MPWEIQRCVVLLLNPSASLVAGEVHGGHQVRQFMVRWDRHLQSWVEQTNIHSLDIWYDDMLKNWHKTFIKLAEFLKISTDTELNNEALSNTSIDRLKKLEDKGDGFIEKPNGCDRFFSSGKSGKRAERLSIEQRLGLLETLEEAMNHFSFAGPENV